MTCNTSHAGCIDPINPGLSGTPPPNKITGKNIDLNLIKNQ